jgi:hypothetical protein
VDTASGTYIYEVDWVGYTNTGNEIVAYTVVTPSGGIILVGPVVLNGI